MNPLALAAEDYLGWLRSHGYAKTTVAGRAHHLADLVEFLEGRDIACPKGVTFAALESYTAACGIRFKGTEDSWKVLARHEL